MIMRRDNLAVLALLILAVVVGWYFRSVGRNWDDYVHFHPDERFMTGSVGINIGRGWLSFSDGNEDEQAMYCREQYPDTNGVGGYFDARCSDFNPHNVGQGFYVYGTLPPFAAYLVANAL